MKSYLNEQSDADCSNWNGCQLITRKRGNSSNFLDFKGGISFLQNYGIFMSVTTLLVIKLLQMRRLLFNTVVYRCLYVIELCARVFIGKAFWV